MTNAPIVCEAPVFIIGSPRSGTSILAWSLAQHSQLWTSTESDVFWHLLAERHAERAYETAAARPDSQDWLRRNDVVEEEFLAHVGLGLNALCASRSEGRRWIDQTPRNTLIAPTLALVFPDALFVHILRDGR